MRAWVLVALIGLVACGAGGHVRRDVAPIDCGAPERGLLIRTDGHAPCASLRGDVRFATAWGEAFGLWPVRQWDGWTLQVVAPEPLPPAWTGIDVAIIGITDLDEQQMLITSGLGEVPFRGCLVHELLHVQRGSGHCHWARLAAMFALLQDQGAFYDECEKVDCAYRGQLSFTCIPRSP